MMFCIGSCLEILSLPWASRSSSSGDGVSEGRLARGGGGPAEG